MKLNKKKKGFTIVELVIVIGVIGILAGILIPTFVNVQAKAEEAALKSNLANAYSAYVADAADGVIDNDVKANVVVGYNATTDADKTYTIELKAQDEIILSTEGTNPTNYMFVNDSWKNEYTLQSGESKGAIAHDDAATPNPVSVKYGGFIVTFLVKGA